MENVRRGWRLVSACAFFMVPLIVGGCAGMSAGRGAQGKVVDGKFTPAHAPAANYGPDATLVCPSTEVMRLMGNEIDRRKVAGKATAQPSGQLCAAAEALLGWPGDRTPPESVLRFVSWHFGLPAALTRVIVATIPSEDSLDIAPNLAEPVATFMQTALDPRYGVATMRAPKVGQEKAARDMRSRGEQGSSSESFSQATRVVVVMQDATLDLAPVPRNLAPGGTITVSGKVSAGIENPKILLCDPQGHLQQPKGTADSAFQTEVKCGDKPGRVLVEIRGEIKGALTTLASFPIGCGSEVPTSAMVPPEGAGSTDLAASEKKLFDLINEERASGGLAPLAADATVAKAARALADSEKQQVQANSGGVALDPVAKLKEVGFVSPVVLQNPAQARSVEEAQARLSLSAVHRCNMLSSEVTHAGIGVALAPAAKPEDPSYAFVSELFVKELGAVDTESLRGKLRTLLAEKRGAARASKLKEDPTLDEIAQKYAAEIAGAGGNEDKEKTSAIVRPLYSGYRTVDIIGGAKNDPMEFAEEPGIIKEGKVYGLGVAQGGNAVLGNNAVYVIIIIGTKK